MNKSLLRKLLADFVNHLERIDSASGWQIVSKSSYNNTRTSTRQRGESRNVKSQRKIVKFFHEWNELGENDLQFEIESFMKSLDSDIVR